METIKYRWTSFDRRNGCVCHCLRSGVAMISDQESLVIRLRFGIGGIGERTLQQVADALNMTKQRVHQIEKAALKKLSKSEKLRSYWSGHVGD